MSEPQPSPFDAALRVADGSWRVARMLRGWMDSVPSERWRDLEGVEEAGVRGAVALLGHPHEGLAVLAVAREPLPGGFPFAWDELAWLVEETSVGAVVPIDDALGPAILGRFGERFAQVGHQVLVDALARRSETGDVPPELHRYWARQGPEHLIGAGQPDDALLLLRDARALVERLRLVGAGRAWPDGIEDEAIESLLDRHRPLLRRRPEAWPGLLYDDCVGRGMHPDEVEKAHGVRLVDLPMRLERRTDSTPADALRPRGPIAAIAVPADGASAVVVDADGVQRWALDGDDAARSDGLRYADVAVTRDGVTQVGADPEGPLAVWSSHAGTPEILDAHAGGALCVALSPDETLVASGGRDFTVAVFDLRERRLVRRLAGHWGSVVDVAWAPDGKEVVSASADGTVRVWSVEGAATDARLLLTAADGATPTACHAHDAWVVVGFHDGSLRSYDLDDGAEQMIERTHSGAIRAIVTHEDGRMFTASDDRTIHVWLTDRQEPVVLRAHAEGVTSLAITGERLLSGSRDHTMIEWDLTTLAPVLRYGGYGWPRDTTERPDDFERPTLTLRSGANVVSRADGRVLAHLPEEREFRARSGVSALAETDGRLVVGTDAGAIEVLALPDLAPVATLRGHRRRVNGLALLEDGRLLSWSLDATIRLWDLDQGRLAATTYGTAPFVGFDVDPSDPQRFSAEDADGARWEMAVGPRRENLLLELVGIEDPVPVGTDQVYVVRVTNQGTQSDSDIRVLVKLPPETEYVDDSGATSGAHEGAVVSFQPLPSLAARAMAEWRVVVRARRAGRGTLTAQMTSDALPFRIEGHVTTRFSERGEPAP